MGNEKTIYSVTHRVWKNDHRRHRYIPCANNPPERTWEIWDQKEGKWVTGEDVLHIDPDEIFWGGKAILP